MILLDYDSHLIFYIDEMGHMSCSCSSDLSIDPGSFCRFMSERITISLIWIVGMILTLTPFFVVLGFLLCIFSLHTTGRLPKKWGGISLLFCKLHFTKSLIYYCVFVFLA